MYIWDLTASGSKRGLLRTEKNDAWAMALPRAHSLRLQINNRYKVGVVG